MARPVLDTILITDPDWYIKINDNFEKLLEAPFPIHQLTGTIPTFNENPALFDDCLGIRDALLYLSDGASWSNIVPDPVDFIANLDPRTATVSTIVSAYNELRSKLIANRWMAAS